MGELSVSAKVDLWVMRLLFRCLALDELQHIADSTDVQRQTKGFKGLEVLNQLRKMKHLDIRIHESDVIERQNVDAKLVFHR